MFFLSPLFLLPTVAGFAFPVYRFVLLALWRVAAGGLGDRRNILLIMVL